MICLHVADMWLPETISSACQHDPQDGGGREKFKMGMAPRTQRSPGGMNCLNNPVSFLDRGHDARFKKESGYLRLWIIS